MSEIKTKIRTYNDVIDLFGEEKAADMLSEALDWSTIDPKNDKKNIMERKPLLLDPYMTYEGEDYCKHIVAGFLGDRDLDWASGYIDEEKIKNGQVMPADLKSALSMALDNELSTSWAYLDALSSQCAEIFNKFAEYIESAGLASGVLVPGEYELDSNALNADVSERFNIQYGFQCDQMIDAMQFDMTLILTEKVDSMDGYRLIQSVCDWREENLEVIEDAENNLDYGKVPSYVAYERPADIGTTIIDELCASQGTAVLDMYDPDGVPVIAYFFPNGYGTKTNDNGCSNVIASLYGRDNFTSYLARAANEEKILYIDSEKYEQMEKELPRYGGTRFPPALAALSMDIIIPSSYICKMKAEINPKLSDREREHNSLNRTMHFKVADSRRNRLAQDRDRPRNITLRYDDDNRDSQ